eukprot:4347926-Pleurochrysis_carterae.AAC.1
MAFMSFETLFAMFKASHSINPRPLTGLVSDFTFVTSIGVCVSDTVVALSPPACSAIQTAVLPLRCRNVILNPRSSMTKHTLTLRKVGCDTAKQGTLRVARRLPFSGRQVASSEPVACSQNMRTRSLMRAF